MALTESLVDADGFRIRYAHGGSGPPLVYIHGAGGFRVTAGLELMAKTRRVVAFEMPGFGDSPENTRSVNGDAMADTLFAACDALGLTSFDLMGTSLGGAIVLRMALRRRDRIGALVLDAPAAIRPASARPSTGNAAERAKQLYARPDRMPPLPEVDPAIQAKNGKMTGRLIGPPRDAALEAAMRDLDLPVLVLFGTHDRIIVPEMGRHYKEILPNCHLSFVYEAGHAIGAERPEAYADLIEDFLTRREALVIPNRETALFP